MAIADHKGGKLSPEAKSQGALCGFLGIDVFSLNSSILTLCVVQYEPDC